MAKLTGDLLTDAALHAERNPMSVLSPEALVKAALEQAAIQVEQGTLGLKGWLDTVRDVQMFMAKNIRALASDPKTVAQIIEAAKEKAND